jgi:catechol 2,3-dioxygenase-like lactoylglutathione lyase family enzyme
MSITSVAHVCIKTTSLEKTARFYCDTLGMKKQFNFTKNGRVIGFYMKASENTFVEVFEVPAPSPSDANGCLSHFCLETDAMEALRQKLIDAGYEPRPIQLGADHSYQFWIKDPNGIDMEFHQYTPESTQRTCKDVEVNW